MEQYLPTWWDAERYTPFSWYRHWKIWSFSQFLLPDLDSSPWNRSLPWCKVLGSECIVSDGLDHWKTEQTPSLYGSWDANRSCAHAFFNPTTVIHDRFVNASSTYKWLHARDKVCILLKPYSEKKRNKHHHQKKVNIHKIASLFHILIPTDFNYYHSFSFTFCFNRALLLSQSSKLQQISTASTFRFQLFHSLLNCNRFLLLLHSNSNRPPLPQQYDNKF